LLFGEAEVDLTPYRLARFAGEATTQAEQVVL
jgi:hypothetical protein